MANGAETIFESGPAQAALIELYTSEGCSSCPPAEAWIAKLRSEPALWKQIVPVAFHVDYWNGLGWRDPFSAPAFSERQRARAKAAGTPVYTPQILLNGSDWSRGSLPPMARDAGTLRVECDGASRVTVSFRPGRPLSHAPVATLAPLAAGITSNVRGGENSGRRLAHEFVALGALESPMAFRDGAWTAQFDLPGKTAAPVAALAAWVHPADDAAPIQAAGGWLKK
jgi:hypothetical protein